jgi:threonine/homoserine/homoserine lactone efflux protein
MIDPITLLTFIPAALALNLTPGVDMMFCLGLGLRSGARPALAASAGISTGGMVHVTLAGLGLGAVIATLPWVFDVIRWVGVGYLLWLARGALSSSPLKGAKIAPKSALRAFRDGMFVNLANPKVILFVLAFIPQFIDPARGTILGQFLIYGLVLAIGGFLVNGGVGIFASSLGRKLTGSPRLTRGLGFTSAAIFTALAARLAFLERA